MPKKLVLDITYPVCSYCLADTTATGLAKNSKNACPTCGADYRGESREGQFNILVNAGAIKADL